MTNDDGIDAPGMLAMFNAVRDMGTVHIVAPRTGQSACSHTLTLYGPVGVERVHLATFGTVYAVDGTPADCVRLACSELLDVAVDLVVSGINRGANSGVDVYYSGTVAGAREGAILGVHSISVSQALRDGVEVNWQAAAGITRHLIHDLAHELLPGQGFWNVNLPAPIPPNPTEHIFRVPVAPGPGPTKFERTEHSDGSVEYRYRTGYWDRITSDNTDYSVIRGGGIAVSAVPLWGRFDEPG